MYKKITLVLAIFLFVCRAPAFADIGVGISNGKIVVDEELKPGFIYELPPITVFNMGTERAEYGINLQYAQNQQELEPGQNWVSFSPNVFSLSPDESQKVTAHLTIPISAKPGEYFAFIDAHPYAETQNGAMTIGVAAGAKLYFTVVPANILEAIYYRIIYLFTEYAPWSYIAVGVIILIILAFVARKVLKIQIRIQKKD